MCVCGGGGGSGRGEEMRENGRKGKGREPTRGIITSTGSGTKYGMK